MADIPINMSVTRKMSFGINGKLNGIECKTPFLIGVSGGTASGKVCTCTCVGVCIYILYTYTFYTHTHIKYLIYICNNNNE
jgi:hypothetical protein